MIYLKLFENHSEYEDFTGSTEYVEPHVSHCIDEDDVHYNMPPEDNAKWVATYADSHTESAECDDTGAIVENEIPNATDAVSVKIGDCVTRIDDYAFINLSGLTSVMISDGLTDINQGAFYGCSGITSIDIPDSVTNIGSTAFKDCYNLASVNIGSGVTNINGWAFSPCRSLINITITAVTPPTLVAHAFDTGASGMKIYVPAESVDAYKAASSWSPYASNIEPIP
jgi:hypothetical protein